MSYRSPLALSALAAAACVACSPPKPPSSWVEGGAMVDTPRARWVRGRSVVDVMPDGRVLVDGAHELTVDRAGRVFEPDGRPVALLEPDGRLVGPDDEDLGVVGTQSAGRPGETTAWLSLEPTGEVVLYGRRGERARWGVWIGCGPSEQQGQACVLVSHLLARDAERPAPNAHFVLGLGVGVGF